MPVVNLRSPEQWKAISAAYDFKGKYVIDVGCGHGDLLHFARDAGAKVFGIDKNATLIEALDVPAVTMDIEYFLPKTWEYFDVAFCFSVLPYVNMGIVLDGLKRVATTIFIECQLIGDGPGTLTEDELKAELESRWDSVKRIGQTVVKGRNTIRPIWMCA